MATTNNVKGWIGVLMTEDSSSHWPTKRRHVYYETSRRAGLEFVCVFGHDGKRALTGPCSVGKEAARGVQNQGQGYRGVAG